MSPFSSTRIRCFRALITPGMRSTSSDTSSMTTPLRSQILQKACKRPKGPENTISASPTSHPKEARRMEWDGKCTGPRSHCICEECPGPLNCCRSSLDHQADDVRSSNRTPSLFRHLMRLMRPLPPDLEWELVSSDTLQYVNTWTDKSFVQPRKLDDDSGPLSSGWEMRLTDTSRIYFGDHNTNTTMCGPIWRNRRQNLS